MTTRYRLILEYDGQGFVGWQRQANGLGVQHAVEDAVQAFCGEERVVFGAGRTDAGVHALAQVAHVDIARTPAPTADTVRDALNFYLRDHPVCVIEAAVAPAGFHARFSAVARHYRYRILNRRPPPVLRRGRVWWVPQPLDADAMAAGAAHFVGTHDFTTFRAVLCQARSPVRTLDRLDVSRVGDEIIIEASARSFLHHQVRNMAGTLKLVGEGRWSAADITRAMAARDRAAGGPTAPSDGLCLVGVDYADGAGGCPVGGDCDETPAAL